MPLPVLPLIRQLASDLRRCAGWLAFVGLSLGLGERVAAAVVVGVDDPRIHYSDYIRMEMAERHGAGAPKSVRFERLLEMPGKGYRWDSPGTRVRFRTTASHIVAQLEFTGLHTSSTARNARGLYSIDGRQQGWPDRISNRGPAAGKAVMEQLIVPTASQAGFHTYEIILPYGDAIDFCGLEVNEEARFEKPEARPSVRYVAYGDSITHGFSASDVSKSYAYLLAQAKDWELLNLGLGGRSSNPDDGSVVAALNPDIVTVFMGANDWQVGVSPQRYRENMDLFLDRIRAKHPRIPIYLMTSLWVADAWKPAQQVTNLEKYRQTLRELAQKRQDANLYVIEGPSLIDHDPQFFDPVPVHPNDRGFAVMAARLARLIQSPPRP